MMSTPIVAQPYRHRIAVLLIYFGRLPWYFRFFQHSCAHNPHVDFILFTDASTGESLPPNLIVIPSSLGEIRKMASEKLGFPVALESAYKLCDFRPAFGLLFEDVLKDYEFWGHGDVDVIYGNIRAIITDTILDSYDIISVRKEFITGFFALYRNNEVNRYLFRQSRDYQKIFRDRTHYCFDECNFNHVPLKKGKSVFELKAEIQCATYVVKKLQLCSAVRAYFGTLVVEELVGGLRWSNGELYYKENPILLFHLIFFKDLPFKSVPSWKEIPQTFYMNSFYWSRNKPGSAKDIVHQAALRTRRFFYLQALRIESYAKWLFKSMKSSGKVKGQQPDFVQSLTGTYKDENVLVEITAPEGRLCARWEKMGTINKVRLFHLRKNRFFIKRIDRTFNIDIEFRYDEKSSDYALHVAPFGQARSVLYKNMA